MYEPPFKEVKKIYSESDDPEEDVEECRDVQDAMSAVFVKSSDIPKDVDIVRGMNFEKEINIHEFVNSFKYLGFQATNMGMGIDEINRMIYYKYIHEHNCSYDAFEMKKKNCIIWLSFTSNMISSGLREIFVYLAKNKFIDVICTTAGGVEEDIIKCFSNTYIGDFHLNGKKLRKKGWNRIGNLIVPNENYCKFEDWLQPLLNEMLKEQNEKNEQLYQKRMQKEEKRKMKDPSYTYDPNINSSEEEESTTEDIYSNTFYFSPSEFIHRLGKEINDESSLMYWCYKNDIPVFCPALTDGSLGDNLFFHNYGRKWRNNLILDIVKDIKKINSISLNCRKSGIIVLGGGVPKHHVCNANLMRNGADFAVYVNTASEYDGSDSGANTTEALSWGKIKSDGEKNNHVKVFGDATILFPLMVLNTFYLYRKKQNELSNGKIH